MGTPNYWINDARHLYIIVSIFLAFTIIFDNKRPLIIDPRRLFSN